MATKWFESIDLIYADMSFAQEVMVVVVQDPEVVLKYVSTGVEHRLNNSCYPVLPLHLGSFANSQAMMVGSFA